MPYIRYILHSQYKDKSNSLFSIAKGLWYQYVAVVTILLLGIIWSLFIRDPCTKFVSMSLMLKSNTNARHKTECCSSIFQFSSVCSNLTGAYTLQIQYGICSMKEMYELRAYLHYGQRYMHSSTVLSLMKVLVAMVVVKHYVVSLQWFGQAGD